MAADEAQGREALLQAFESIARILDEEDFSDVDLGKGAVVIDWRFLRRVELAYVSLREPQRTALYDSSARCRHAGDAAACDRLRKVIERAEHRPSANDAVLEPYREQLMALPPEGLGLLTSIRSPWLLDEWCPPPESTRRARTRRGAGGVEASK